MDISLSLELTAYGSRSSSSTGIVNIYGADAVATGVGAGIHPKALKTLTNLTMPISTLRFDPSSQVMAMASRTAKNQLRLVSLPFCIETCILTRSVATSPGPLAIVDHLRQLAYFRHSAWARHIGRFFRRQRIYRNRK
jgi:hypothetical protein